ncbi:unnamed protein product [Lasius platythorax]|uniref:Uncharacterized protein n=1 Tax=Lasius platythorax TaxID=488582 RepID=A0AAV2PA44_9HYME
MVGETTRDVGCLRSPTRLLAGANCMRLLRTKQVSAARRQRDATEPLFSSFNSPTEPAGHEKPACVGSSLLQCLGSHGGRHDHASIFRIRTRNVKVINARRRSIKNH